MRNLKLIVKQKGLAAIEFSVIAPFLFLLIFATAEFGRLFYQYNALTSSVRQASRYISDLAYKGNVGVPSLTDAEKSKASNLIISGDTNGQSELLPGLAQATITYELNGDLITVNVSYIWEPIFSSTLFSTVGGDGISLNFPMNVSYTVRALP